MATLRQVRPWIIAVGLALVTIVATSGAVGLTSLATSTQHQQAAAASLIADRHLAAVAIYAVAGPAARAGQPLNLDAHHARAYGGARPPMLVSSPLCPHGVLSPGHAGAVGARAPPNQASI
jgi:hypothetical protein